MFKDHTIYYSGDKQCSHLISMFNKTLEMKLYNNREARVTGDREK